MLFMLVSTVAQASVCEVSPLNGPSEVAQVLSEGEDMVQFPVGSPVPPRPVIKVWHAVGSPMLNAMLRLGIP